MTDETKKIVAVLEKVARREEELVTAAFDVMTAVEKLENLPENVREKIENFRQKANEKMTQKVKLRGVNPNDLNIRECCGEYVAAGTRCPVCGKSAADADYSGAGIAQLEPVDRHALGEKVGTAQKISSIAGKLRVTITRGNRGKPLDNDNFVGGCKPFRDEIARLLGRDDAEQTGIEWEYRQAPGSIRMVEIEKIGD